MYTFFTKTSLEGNRRQSPCYLVFTHNWTQLKCTRRCVVASVVVLMYKESACRQYMVSIKFQSSDISFSSTHTRSTLTCCTYYTQRWQLMYTSEILLFKLRRCWAHVYSYLSTACLVCGFSNPPSHWTMKVPVLSCRVVTSRLTFWKCVSELWGSPHTPCLPVLRKFTPQIQLSPWHCLQPPSGVRRGGDCQMILGAPFLVTPYPLRGHDP